MSKLRLAFSFISFLIAMLLPVPVYSQSATQKPLSFNLQNFDEARDTCRAKGRLQDKEYCQSQMMDQIVAKGKSAIPILISQLNDNRATKEPIFDFWYRTTVGDIAHSILDDLFTDSDWETFTMPGLWSSTDGCSDGIDAESCWREFIKKHGRKYVQNQWLAAWNANKDRIYWDEKARCFRVAPLPKAR